MDIDRLTLTVSIGLALLMLLPLLDQYIKLFPALIGSLFSTSTAVRTEDKCKLSRSRNHLFTISILPFCILVWHKELYCPDWMGQLEAPWNFLSTAGVVLLYFLLRYAIKICMPAPRISKKVYAAFCGLPRTFLIILVTFLLPPCIAMDAFDVPLGTEKIVFYTLSTICYILFLARRFHIFTSEGNFLQAILYLCTLEILPTAVLVVLSVVF